MLNLLKHIHTSKILAAVLFLSIGIKAQTPISLNSTRFSTTEGVMLGPFENIIKDAFGFMWFTSNAGTQRFDGANFHYIPVSEGSKGIPDNRNVIFLNLKNGQLLISHSKGISIYETKRNIFTHNTLSNKNIYIQQPLLPLFELTENDVWFYSQQQGLILINIKNFDIKDKIQTTTHTAQPSKIYAIDKKNGKFLVAIENSLLMFDLKQRRLIKRFALPKSVIGAALSSKDNILLFDKKGVQILGENSGKIERIIPYPNNFVLLEPSVTVHTDALSNHNLLIALDQNLWEFDTENLYFSAIITNRQKKNYIENGYYTHVYADGDRTFWLSSNVEGLRRVDNFNRSIRYYGTANQALNFTKCLLVDKKANRVISGTYEHGILIFDTLQRLIRHIPQPDPSLPNLNTITSIVDLDSENCLFLMYNSIKIYVLNKKTGNCRAVSDWNYLTGYNSGNISNYYGVILPAGNNTFYYPINNGLFKFQYQNQKISPVIYIETGQQSYVGTSLTEGGMVWGNSGAIFYIDKNNKTNIYSIDNKHIKYIIEDKNKNIWAATPNGIYIFTTPQLTLKKILNVESGLPNEHIYALAKDKQNNIWFSHNKGISRIDDKNSILTLTKSDGLQESEFNTSSVYQANDGELFFGGVNGISSFYPDDIKNAADTPSVFFTNLRVNGENYLKDTAFWQLNRLELPYARNNISFEYSAIGLQIADNYNYQIRLVGQDADWVNMGNERIAQYQLSAGEHIIELYAARSFDAQAVAKRRILVVIKPPFWKTWWFITILLSFAAITISMATRFILNRKYRKKLAELALQRQIQSEKVRISRDLHDNLGAQLSHIVRNTEWLSNRNKIKNEEDKQRLEDIYETAKQSMMTLRESIWTLNREQISIEDFSDRFKKYAFQHVKSSPQVELTYKENIEKNNILKPEQSLQMHRIFQEALNNALKYAQATRIAIDFQSTDNQLFIGTIKDNGIGFDYAANKHNGNGLENMERRAKLIDADISIESHLNEGTSIILKI